MIHFCSQCGRKILVESPGIHRCSACGAGFEINSREFPLSDVGRPEESSFPKRPQAETYPTGNPPGFEQKNEGDKFDGDGDDSVLLCERCGKKRARWACGSCGKLVCESCSSESAGSLPRCTSCDQAKRPDANDFENLAAGRFWSCFFPTIKSLVVQPKQYFERLPVPGRFWPGLIFGMAVVYPVKLALLFFTLWSLEGRLSEIQAQIGVDIPEFVLSLISDPTFHYGLLFSAVVLQPLLTLAGLFASGAFIHIVLLILGRPGGRFEDTVRVLGYAKVTELANLVPVLGTFLSPIWSVVLVSIGLGKVHRIPTWKAVLVAISPIFAMCAFFVSIIIVVVALSSYLVFS